METSIILSLENFVVAHIGQLSRVANIVAELDWFVCIGTVLQHHVTSFPLQHCCHGFMCQAV